MTSGHPEMMDGRAWSVIPGAPRTDPRARVMSLPPDVHPDVRVHEYIHGRISTEMPDEMMARLGVRNVRAVQAAEDARVQAMAAKYVRPADFDFLTLGGPAPAESDAYAVAESACTAAALHETKQFKAALAQCAPAIRHLLVETLPHAASPRGRDDLARMLDSLFPDPSPADDDGERELIEKPPMDAAPPAVEQREGGSWAEMELIEGPMDEVVGRARGPRQVDYGPGVVRQPWRVLSDRAMWRRRVVGTGSAVLIDGSGSMQWDNEDLKAAARLPGSVVAVYSGNDDKGQLYIVGRDGRVSSRVLAALKDRGSGNMIDGPALEWLGRQRGRRRVWVSDGVVTGVREECTAALVRESMEIAARIGAVRVPDGAALVRALGFLAQEDRP